MKKQKLSFQHADGKIEGIYLDAGENSTLVIIVNGHNGFYNYGMFPYIQESFWGKGISSYSFNFSHGGIKGDGDYFEDLHSYEQNCMRLETEDVMSIFNEQHNLIEKHSQIILLAHSLGGVPALFAAKKLISQNKRLNGIILVCTVKTLNFWPADMLNEWATAGVLFRKNNRTKQDLPQGFEFLQEIMASERDWNVEKVIRSLELPILIIVGSADESVPPEHGRSLYEWIKETNPTSSFKIVEGASHTFNTKHPFEGPTPQLEELLDLTTKWIKDL
jgi:pimeloyl-ACP methyl ester carboxylesterase